MTERQVLIGCLSALGAMVIAGIGIADYRLEKYEVMAENAAKDAGIETAYHVSSDVDTKEEFFKELSSLISWEEKNSAAIDTTFEYDISKHRFSNGYEDTSILLGIDSDEKIKEHIHRKTTTMYHIVHSFTQIIHRIIQILFIVSVDHQPLPPL